MDNCPSYERARQKTRTYTAYAHIHAYIHIYVPPWRRSTCLLPLYRAINITVTVTVTSKRILTSGCRKKTRPHTDRALRLHKRKRAPWGYLSDRMESQHDCILQPLNRLQQVCYLHHQWFPAGGTQAISHPQRNLILNTAKCFLGYDGVW
jgi:hypothetical protein